LCFQISKSFANIQIKLKIFEVSFYYIRSRSQIFELTQATQAREQREDSPRPSTSSRSQTPSQTQVLSEFVTPRAVVRPKNPKARTLFTPRTPRSIHEEEEDVDSPGVISVRSETDSD
jgi:hypothetical protein